MIIVIYVWTCKFKKCVQLKQGITVHPQIKLKNKLIIPLKRFEYVELYISLNLPVFQYFIDEFELKQILQKQNILQYVPLIFAYTNFFFVLFISHWTCIQKKKLGAKIGIQKKKIGSNLYFYKFDSCEIVSFFIGVPLVSFIYNIVQYIYTWLYVSR